MNKIIGGEFSINSALLKLNNDKVAEKSEIAYSSGRCALFAILSDIASDFRETGTIFLPDYLCESITQTVIDAGWNYHFYHVNSDLHMDTGSIYENAENGVFLLIDYFGMIDLSDDITFIREHFVNSRIIADFSQAFYKMNDTSADYSFTSLRKWFPCPDGGIVRKNIPGEIKSIQFEDNQWVQYKFAGNLLKEYNEFVDDSFCLDLLSKGEQILDKNYLCESSDACKIIFETLDLQGISNSRKQNALVLHEELQKMGVNHLYSAGDTPLFVPIFVEKRDELRRCFFAENIFTPKHWSYINDKLNNPNELYNTELSLICDQRYDEQDMLRQINVLKEFLKKN